MNEISVSINKKNLNKIVHYAQAAYEEHKAEIGGMAVCVKGDDNEWVIENPIILKQEITGTNCSLNQEELAKYYVNTAANKKYKKKDWRFLWWHSHHMMQSFWSGTDLTAIDEFSDGDLSFALVVNLKGDYLVRASAWNLGMHQDMDLNVMETATTVPKKILDEVNDKCETRKYVGWTYSKDNKQLTLATPTESKTPTLSKKEEKFTELWLKLVDEMDEKISEACKGQITIENLKKVLAGANGDLSRHKVGMRINYSDINKLDDLLTLQPWELIEVDEKYQNVHDDLLLEAVDSYSYNWSYGANRRYW
tara:strand:- start:24380 stop:25303 length:924 start_codon:yes stop_codon:yes gene_type:complete